MKKEGSCEVCYLAVAELSTDSNIHSFLYKL